MVTNPVYKDTYYQTDEEKLVYTITCEGVQIFSGKAYKLPNADTLSININKICQNYLSNDIESLLEGDDSYITEVNAYKTFLLNDSEGNVLETYRFLYCWDYGFDFDGSDTVLSNPINGHYADGMLTPRTTVSNGVVKTYREDSTVNPDNLICGGEYCVYYLSARGGWDYFLFEGTVKKTDTITQYTADKAFNNNTIQFEASRYISEIITSYEMNTGYLSDEQAENLALNLIGSNKVYIHDLKDGKIKPAIITDTEAKYQTYRTNGKKLAQYTIKIKESQSKIRK